MTETPENLIKIKYVSKKKGAMEEYNKQVIEYLGSEGIVKKNRQDQVTLIVKDIGSDTSAEEIKRGTTTAVELLQ